MIKKGVVLILVCLLLIQTALAVEFDIKDNYKSGETMIAKVSGNFLEPIQKENVFFYRGHVRIPMEYDVSKIDGDFYIYALLDKPENNYSISIEGVKYMSGKNIVDDDIVKNFSITNETADFSVKPGFIVASDDFSVEVQNLQDKKIDISTSDGRDFTLNSGEIKDLTFKTDDFNSSEVNTLELYTTDLLYDIPVYIFSTEKEDKYKMRSFEIEPQSLKVSMATNSTTSRYIYIQNTGDATLDNVSIFVSDSLIPYASFLISEFDEIEKNSSVKIEIDFNSPENEGTVDGRLVVDADNLTESSDINLNFVKNYIPANGSEENIVSVSETCAEKNGTVCKSEETCDGETVYAKDDICCLGTCGTTKTSSSGKIIGWLIIIVIFVFLVWFFLKKYRGAR